MPSKAALITCVLVVGSVLIGTVYRNASSAIDNESDKPSVENMLTDGIIRWSDQFHDMDLVGMSVFGSSRYGLTEDGSEDWNHLMPSGGHLVRFPLQPHSTSTSNNTTPSSADFTVTLFHELKCLSIYREEYMAVLASRHNSDSPPTSSSTRQPSPLVRHCLNYLRQRVLCRMDLKLEYNKDLHAKSSRQYETVCRDWERVYEAAEKNARGWSESHSK
ncbi:hypothetical protein K435DRAFT_772810 [Dendrothele bispora CBS 962.96]|uniref:Uncharacterized protein n=1 Tax=Dendrothele bispora (strain CBS 962.96) TaxID=1314807 RepID=A0A4S8MUZ6_DENBC|nr:hypothetical protein K435DRAFT_772810 [Dendrothele bispora CBS 962.96]